MTIFKFFCAFAFLLVFSACNKTTKLDSEANPNNQEKQTVFSYPHAKSFFLEHGAGYLKNKAECLSCHGTDGVADSAGGNTGVSCLSCHSSFPHPKNWAVPSQHSEAFKKEPQSCALCHGSDWKGGKALVGCTSCHAAYPHQPGWASPSVHGKAFVAVQDKKECLSCHDPEKKEATATRCDSCHKAFPHPKGFVNGGHAPLAQTYDGQCTSCHRNFKENMPNKESKGGCLSCHDGSLKIQWIEDPVPPADPPKDPPKDPAKEGERKPSSAKKKVKKKI